MKHITLTLSDVQRLVELYGGDNETEISLAIVEKGQRSHSGPGVYAYYTDYPAEGSTLITEPEHGVEYDGVTYFDAWEDARDCRKRSLRREYKQLELAARTVHEAALGAYARFRQCRSATPPDQQEGDS